MKNFILFIGLCFFVPKMSMAQEKPVDTITPKDLKEVIVIGKKSQLYQNQAKPLATIDEYLQQSTKVAPLLDPDDNQPIDYYGLQWWLYPDQARSARRH